MKEYLENLNPLIIEYFNILSKEIPEFLLEYIKTPEMQRLDKISALVGNDYTKLFNVKFFYSSLSHSVGVALIIWNFTKDKKQTLAGLFHDIASPAFRHCIDYLNGDYLLQESTQINTSEIIKNSKEIMKLLERDNIKLQEVDDYTVYSIADNSTPKLSADRLEYTFSDILTFIDGWNLDGIKEIYNDICVMKNEDNIDELGFKSMEIAEKFVEGASMLWYSFQSNKDKLKSQFIADIIKKMNNKNLMNKEDLYTKSENEIVQMIENCEYKEISEAFKKFRKLDKIGEGENKPENKYCVNLNIKRRYIVPLACGKRINDISLKAKNIIEKVINYNSPKYGWLDFDF